MEVYPNADPFQHSLFQTALDLLFNLYAGGWSYGPPFNSVKPWVNFSKSPSNDDFCWDSFAIRSPLVCPLGGASSLRFLTLFESALVVELSLVRLGATEGAIMYIQRLE